MFNPSGFPYLRKKYINYLFMNQAYFSWEERRLNSIGVNVRSAENQGVDCNLPWNKPGNFSVALIALLKCYYAQGRVQRSSTNEADPLNNSVFVCILLKKSERYEEMWLVVDNRIVAGCTVCNRVKVRFTH